MTASGRRNQRGRHRSRSVGAKRVQSRPPDAAAQQQRVEKMRQPRLEDLLQQLQRVGDHVVIAMRQVMEGDFEDVEEGVEKRTDEGEGGKRNN